jgi:hypothetical protein
MKNHPPAAESEPLESQRARRNLSRVGLNARSIEKFLGEVVEFDLHTKTVLSLALGTLGVLHAVSLCIHVVGRALAAAQGGNAKHCIKQFDRLLSNHGVSPKLLAPDWIRFVIGNRPEIVVALDWTEFDADDHSTLALYLVTRHGRATPLIWNTVKKSALRNRRNRHEDRLLKQFHDALPAQVRVTVLADRGFGDKKRYACLKKLGFDYVVRFREGILVTNEFGEQKPASDWLCPSGRARMFKDMAVTKGCYVVPAVVAVHDKRMKESWCLATSRSDLVATEIVKLYSRRFSIEETFRDQKNVHFGMGLSATHIHSAARRDRLLLVAALAHVLLTLLGAAGERAGLDRQLKSNTTERRTLSLYNQGCFWYSAIPNMPEERLVLLMTAYGEVLREHELLRDFFGII